MIKVIFNGLPAQLYIADLIRKGYEKVGTTTTKNGTPVCLLERKSNDRNISN